MLIKTTIALAMALTMGLASTALAAKNGGYRQLGPGGSAHGANPADHRSLGGNKPDMIMSDNGQCWGLNKSMIGGWSDCRRH